MVKVKLLKVFRGVQETKFGTKDKIALKTDKHGDKWVSSFKTKGTENWKEGDEVSIAVQAKGDFLNFTLEEVAGAVDLSGVEARLTRLETKVFGEKVKEVNPDDEDGSTIW